MAEKLEMGFDQLLYELSKGHTIERTYDRKDEEGNKAD